jgi:hypothetical protein
MRLAWQLAKAGGRTRFVLLAGCTAIVSGLLLVAVAIARINRDSTEALFSVVADPGTRGGVIFATILLALPPLLLLDQAVRLGTVDRERRLAALRVAGATPSEVRRLGAIEVGIPTAVGGVGGLAVYELFRTFLGGSEGGVCAAFNYEKNCVGYSGSGAIGLVPRTVEPLWWQTLLVVVAVAAIGALVGYRASPRVISAPLGLTRRQPKPAPRPWGFGLLIVAALAAGLGFKLDVRGVGLMLVFAAIALLLSGIMSLSPWLAFQVARRVAARVESSARILAAQRIVTEPRPAGRAAAAIGGISLVAGGMGAFLADLAGIGDNAFESERIISVLLVAVCLLIGLLVVAGSLAVHTVESLIDRKREMAFLAAAGTPIQELDRAQRFEIALVALPMALVGVLAGTVSSAFLMDSWSPLGLAIMAATIAITLGLVWAATALAARAVRPWSRRAIQPANLRTE